MTGIAVVVGARPNFVKAAPVVAELTRRGIVVTLVHTGQHYDTVMSDQIFADLSLPDPDVHLGAGSGSMAEQTSAVMTSFERVLAERVASMTVVFGDVNSTLACALVSARAGVPVAHVEAGLRSGDWAMPEEINRVVTDRVSHLLLAPSQDAVDNLVREGSRPEQIHLVGNVMVDTLRSLQAVALARPTLRDIGVEPDQYVVLTLHRPSNVDDGDSLQRLLSATARAAAGRTVVFPAHPRTRRILDAIAVPSAVTVLEPLGYLDFIALQAGAALVLTDSGGVQEETTALGVPCLTLRTTTERPLTVTEGTNRLVGPDPDTIARVAAEVLADPPPARCPTLWDGRAARRIGDAIERGLEMDRYRAPGPAPALRLMPEGP